MKGNTKVAIVPPVKNEMVKLFKTSYHYYRNWVKDILIEGDIKDFKFQKDRTRWSGVIIIVENEVDKANVTLKDYKARNIDEVKLWW